MKTGRGEKNATLTMAIFLNLSEKKAVLKLKGSSPLEQGGCYLK